MKSDICPQLTTLESAVGAEDYKFWLWQFLLANCKKKKKNAQEFKLPLF